MHAYSEIFDDMAGIDKRQLVHDLAIMTLTKQINGTEPAPEIYERYEALRISFLKAVNE